MGTLGWFITGPFLYFSIAVCIVGSVYKFRKYEQMPRHLRWDIYPLPHLGTIGSKYAKLDFRNEPKHYNMPHVMSEMLQEILFLKRTYLHNKKVWVWSFLLHWGLYLGIAAIVALAVGGMFILAGVEVTGSSASYLGRFGYYVTPVLGDAAAVFGLVGALRLLILRLSDENLRSMSDAVTYFNLILMITLFAPAFWYGFSIDPTYGLARNYLASLLTGNPVASNPWMVFQMLFLGIFLILLPFTRLFHPVAKHFFYFDIMWEDEAMKPGSDLEKDVLNSLAAQVDWSAAHINRGTWLDQLGPSEKKEGEGKS